MKRILRNYIAVTALAAVASLAYAIVHPHPFTAAAQSLECCQDPPPCGGPEDPPCPPPPPCPPFCLQ